MSEQAVRAIVAGHGTFAAGIISAVEQIAGRGDRLIGVSNAGLCMEDIQGSLIRAVDETGAQVIFTDLPAGSCTMAVRRLLRERPGVVLVTGVNLSTILDFVLQDDKEPVEAAKAAIERGRQSMVAHGV